MQECTCRRKRQYERRIKRAGLQGVVDRYTFTNYTEYSEDAQRCKELATLYIRGKCYKRENSKNLIFAGQVGSGKTHLAMATVNNALDRGADVYYMDYRSYMSKIKTLLIDPVEYRKMIEQARDCDVLYIDDLCKGKITETDINILYEIINPRYQNRKSTIVTTEKSISELLEIDEGIGSRLYTANKDILINMPAYNYRLKK